MAVSPQAAIRQRLTPKMVWMSGELALCPVKQRRQMEPACILRSYQQRAARQRDWDEDHEYGLCSLKGSLGPPDPHTHTSPSSPSACEAKGL